MTETNVPAQASDEPMAWRYRLREKVGSTQDKWSVTDNALFVAKMGWAFEIEPLYATPRATADVERLPNWRKLTRWTFDGGSMFAEVSKDGQWLAVKDVECMMAHIDAAIAATKGAKQ